MSGQPSWGAEGLLVGTLGWLKEPISGGTADRRRLGRLHGGSWLGKKRREGEEEKGSAVVLVLLLTPRFSRASMTSGLQAMGSQFLVAGAAGGGDGGTRRETALDARICSRRRGSGRRRGAAGRGGGNGGGEGSRGGTRERGDVTSGCVRDPGRRS